MPDKKEFWKLILNNKKVTGLLDTSYKSKIQQYLDLKNKHKLIDKLAPVSTANSRHQGTGRLITNIPGYKENFKIPIQMYLNIIRHYPIMCVS